MKHRGEIVEKAIKQSNITFTAVAKGIGVDRKTIYNYVHNDKLPLDVIVEIGKVIKYDFRKDFPELFIQNPSDMVHDEAGNYDTKDVLLKESQREAEEWKNKYFALLEEHNLKYNSLLEKYNALLEGKVSSSDNNNDRLPGREPESAL